MITFLITVKINNNHKLIINSFIFSIVLNVKIFSVILRVENIIPVILLVSLLCTFMVNGLSIIISNITKLKIMFYYMIITTFLWIIAPNHVADLYYMSAIIFGIPAMIITNVKISYYWITFISLILGLLLYGSIEVSSLILEGDAGEKMYYSYLILPFILFSIFGFSLYKKDLYIIFLSVINLIIYVPILVGVGVRGVYVSLLLFFILMLIKTDFFQNKKKYIVVPVIVLTFLIFSIDWLNIIENASAWLANYDIHIYMLDKYIMMFTNNDVSNGRLELYQNAFSGFLASPIWGNGFGVFEKENEGLYVHNIFLEILFEGGLLLSIIFIYAFYRFVKIVKECKKIEADYFLFVVLLFVIGCSILLFSNSLWRVVSFWLFFGVILNKFQCIKD